MIGIENSGYDKQVARILITGPKAGGWGAKAGRRVAAKEKGEDWRNKPNRVNMLFINNMPHKWEKQTQR